MVAAPIYRSTELGLQVYLAHPLMMRALLVAFCRIFYSCLMVSSVAKWGALVDLLRFARTPFPFHYQVYSSVQLIL